MKTVGVAELRAHLKEWLDAVDKGETVRVIRQGKPVADLIKTPASASAWKEPFERVEVSGLPLSQAVMEERGSDEEQH